MSNEVAVGAFAVNRFRGLVPRQLAACRVSCLLGDWRGNQRAGSARAWGCEGHQVIALLAEKHLTPHALATANQILKDNPIDPSMNRFCKQGGLDAMADSSTWADDYRTLHPETGPWHYIDIRFGTTLSDRR